MPEEKIKGKTCNVLNDNYQVVQIAYEVGRTLENLKGIRLDINKQEIGSMKSYRVSGSRFYDTFKINFESSMSEPIEQMWDKLEEGV